MMTYQYVISVGCTSCYITYVYFVIFHIVISVPPIIYILAIRRSASESRDSKSESSTLLSYQNTSLDTLLLEAEDRHIVIPQKLQKRINVTTMSCVQDDDEYIVPWKYESRTCMGMIWWIITFPWRLLFHVTVPSSYQSTWKVTLTTIMITIWMSILSWHVIWMSTEISITLQIPTMILGAVVLSVGQYFSSVVCTL